MEASMIEIIYQYDPNLKQREPRPTDAEQAQARLTEGNRQMARFWSLSYDPDVLHREVIPFDPGMWGIEQTAAEAPPHKPFAAVLSCSDARVPTELIFRQTLNDLFVVRLAGNVIATEGIGSLAYAVRHLGESLKLLVVLGHTGCGAVTAAVDAYLSPSQYPEITPAIGLRSIVDRIFVAVRGAAKALDRANETKVENEAAYRDKLIGISIVLNAALTGMALRQLLADVISVDCKVVFGVYDLAMLTVWAPHVSVDPPQWKEPRLADPPASFEQLEQLAQQLAGLDDI
jgi:carbonic anhydrase